MSQSEVAPLRHLAVIMDGNRRYARAQGKSSLEGHRAGYETLKRMVDWALGSGIEVFTVWAFSTENWKRAQEEVGYLMELLEYVLLNDVKTFHEKGIRVKMLGRMEGFSASIQRGIREAEELTKDNTALTMCIALNYGGRAEIVDAVKKIVASGVSAADITEDVLSAQMYWPDMPAPDLIVRTSGEQRLSGYLLWEAPYAEIIWSDKFWPEVTSEDAKGWVNEYYTRQRRFGK